MTTFAERLKALREKETSLVLPKDFFNRIIEADDGCWIWTADKSWDGYGHLYIKRRRHRAHRFMWELMNGAIPAGLLVCHGCDNKPCVNVEHLFLGTPKDNTLDMLSKGRSAKGEAHGSHVLTEKQVKEILKRKHLGGYHWGETELAERFGVRRMTISEAARNITWKHLIALDKDAE